jgi:glycosyltransferase involved in cell wall biosynthesis
LYYFSIIIPLYNKERHIERCLNSVFAQTYKNYEIIVVDDGSTDNSVNIVSRYSITDTRYQIRIFRQENGGVSSARNKGIREAKYQYIAFLDADDAWKPLFLENIVSLINKFPEAGAYATDYDIIRINNRRYIPHHKFIPKQNSSFRLPASSFHTRSDSYNSCLIPNYFKSMIYGEPMITSSSICIKKETFHMVGFFPEEERLGEDKDMWARIALVYPVAFSWYLGATYFENADNRTCLKYIPNYERYFIKTLQKKLDSGEVPTPFIRDVRKYVSQNLVSLAAKNIKTGNSAFAKKLLRDKRCDLSYADKIIWTALAYVPFRILHISINILKYLRDYPLFYFLSSFSSTHRSSR